MAEWLNAPVLKTGKGASPSRVRIPVCPPLINKPAIERVFLMANLNSIIR
tara:strand:- start:10225 stop:10374 length:150 start_codon:yes stop_codon:yes gene_type:complete